MRLLKTPESIDLILELTPQEWVELGRRFEALSDLLFSNPLQGTRGEHYLARVGGAWILILLKEGPGSRGVWVIGLGRPERLDWRVEVTVDREPVAEEIIQLLEILKRRRISCIVAAVDEDEAVERASRHLEIHMGIPNRFMRNLHPRMLR
jgi:hypothetical protein